jgi:myo-inositol-1(or 4)-monophosphatase
LNAEPLGHDAWVPSQTAASLEALLHLALRAAQAAGALLRERAAAPAEGLAVKSSATDPVTEADRASEALVRGMLARERPEDGILGEEGGDDGFGASGLRWVVDPLDGTVNFLYGLPAWCVSIACEDEQGALAGVVHDPLRGETFAALRGHGATLGGRRLQVRDPVPLELALIATGFAYRSERRALQASLAATVLPRVRDLRRAGSAALDLAWVAAGRLDGFYEHGLNPWDVCAGALLVREAGGGTATAPPLDGADGLVAAAPGLLEPLLALVAGGDGQSCRGAPTEGTVRPGQASDGPARPEGEV